MEGLARAEGGEPGRSKWWLGPWRCADRLVLGLAQGRCLAPGPCERPGLSVSDGCHAATGLATRGYDFVGSCPRPTA